MHEREGGSFVSKTRKRGTYKKDIMRSNNGRSILCELRRRTKP